MKILKKTILSPLEIRTKKIIFSLTTYSYRVKDVLNEELFISLAPKADDIWLKAMSLLTKTKCQLITDHRPFDKRFTQIPYGQEIALSKFNCVEKYNLKEIL